MASVKATAKASVKTTKTPIRIIISLRASIKVIVKASKSSIKAFSRTSKSVVKKPIRASKSSVRTPKTSIGASKAAVKTSSVLASKAYVYDWRVIIDIIAGVCCGW